MSYDKLNLSSLNFSDSPVTMSEALKDVSPLNIPSDVISKKKQLKVTKAEKDYERKCVKLEISY